MIPRRRPLRPDHTLRTVRHRPPDVDSAMVEIPANVRELLDFLVEQAIRQDRGQR